MPTIPIGSEGLMFPAWMPPHTVAYAEKSDRNDQVWTTRIQTYTCAHQRRRLLKGQRVWEQHHTLRVTGHVLCKPTIIQKTGQSSILAESDIASSLTGYAGVALMLEEVDADALSNLPLAVDLGTNSYNSPDRLVRGYDGAGRFVYAFHDL